MNKQQKIAVLLLTGVTGLSYAAPDTVDSAGLFDLILHQFEIAAASWASKITDYASWLFWSLAMISMCWTYGFMILRRADIQEFFSETIRFFVSLGFFWWLLIHGSAIATAIMDSLRTIASHVSGFNKMLSPSGIVDVGFDIVSKVIDQSSIWSPASSTVGLMVAIVILVILALIAVNMLILLISAWIMAYAGVFILGFGGGKWTEDTAIAYFKDVAGIGMQLFTMILIVGVGKSFIDQYYLAMHGDISLKMMCVMLVVSIILLSLVKTVPPMLSVLISCKNFGSHAGAGEAIAAAGLASAAMGKAASAMMGAGVSVAGGASALKAAFSAAQQSTGGSGGSIGGAAKMAASMGGHLARGAMSVAKERSQTHGRVANTLGGRVASAIQGENPS